MRFRRQLDHCLRGIVWIAARTVLTKHTAFMANEPLTAMNAAALVVAVLVFFICFPITLYAHLLTIFASSFAVVSSDA